MLLPDGCPREEAQPRHGHRSAGGDARSSARHRWREGVRLRPIEVGPGPGIVGRRPAETLLTPSKITAWLDCGHYLTLGAAVESGGGARRRIVRLDGAGSSREGPAARGGVPRGVPTAGQVDLEIPPGRTGPSARSTVVGDPFARRPDVIYQMPSSTTASAASLTSSSAWTTQTPVEPRTNPSTPLTRAEAKPGHVLQVIATPPTPWSR